MILRDSQEQTYRIRWRKCHYLSLQVLFSRLVYQPRSPTLFQIKLRLSSFSIMSGIDSATLKQQRCSYNFQGLDLQRTKVFALDSCLPQNRMWVVFVGTSRVVNWPSYSIRPGFTWIIICGHRGSCPRLTGFLFWWWRTDEFKYTFLIEYLVMEVQYWGFWELLS